MERALVESVAARALVKVAYADPPYPGMARYYVNHPDYGGEVDHDELLARLVEQYDGWVLHTAATTLHVVLDAARAAGAEFRIGCWIKPFASFKPSQRLAYAWEPVLLSPCRSSLDDAPRSGEVILRDYVEVPDEFELTSEPCVREPIAMRRGLIGAKPERVCRWAFEAIGLLPDDEFVDLYPGSGAVTRAHETWRAGRAGVLDEPGQLWSDDAEP